MKTILLFGMAAALGLTIAFVVSNGAPGFNDCGAFGYGWAPVWVNGIPDCTYMGVYESGCCYRVDGNDTFALLFLGLLPIGLILIAIAGVFGWIGGHQRELALMGLDHPDYRRR